MLSGKSHAKNRVKGSISLTTVILAGAILIVTGMAVLTNAIDIAMSTKSYFGKTVAETRIPSCVEESLLSISKLTTFTGTVTVPYTDGNCTSIVTNVVGDPTKKLLTITATYGEYSAKRVKKVDTTTSPMTLSN